MNGWRAYFADGQRIDSAQSSWADLPAEGLVGVVVFEDPPYRHLVYGGDWTWIEDGEIHKSSTVWGDWVNPPEIACRSCLKRGAAMSDADFELVQAEMMRDRRWP